MKHLLRGVLLSSALVAFSPPARAEKESLLLEYRAGPGCPDRERFVERVHSFTTKAEIANDDGALRRKFRVRVSRAAGGMRGELTIDDRGAKTTRSVTGTTCDEVVSALALATALAVDPNALDAPVAVESPAPEPQPAPEPPAPEPPPAPKPLPPKPVPRPPPARVAPPPERRYALDLSLGARLGGALAPFPKYEGTVQLGTTYFAPVDLYLGAAFGPAQHNSAAEFASLLGWVGTGYRFFELEPVSVWGHAAFELGQVQATGLGISPARRVEKPWAAVDVGLSVRVDAPGRLFFQFDASGRAPLSLQRYVVLENTGKLRELHQVQQLGYLLGLSVGMHFL